MSKGTISIEDLLKFADAVKKHEANAKPHVRKPITKDERRTANGKSWYTTEEERIKILKLRASGLGIATLAKKLGRSEKCIRTVIRSVEPVKPVATTIVLPPEEGAAPDGIGTLKRSMERLHDRVSKLDAQLLRLSDITSGVAKLQQSVDRITREFVNTNPPPELVTGRNGHAKV